MLILFVYSFMFLYMSLLLFFISMMFFYFNFLLNFMWEIYFYGSVKFEFFVFFDWMSLLFVSLVFFISSMVLLYSVEYMKFDLNIVRFSYLLIMFILSMMLMIFCPNILSILLGWDGLGLVSFCLVIFYQNYSSLNSGMLTVLCNRVGDVGLLMLIGFLMCLGSWNLFFLFIDSNLMVMIIVSLLMLSSLTKSAQMPFSVWLPAAMAAPTPVSSLVHSSTLVTAGVYLLIRYNFLFNYNDSKFNLFLLIISSMTMFMAGFCAMFEFDLKKIIALSTLSQLGLMMSILSIGFLYVSFFHLLIHALFKSLLFLCAGMMIHCMFNIQDIRLYGNLFNMMPLISLVFGVGILSLCGFPFLAGFYSKDLIMELMFMSKMNFISLLMLMISTIFTVSYSFRLILYLFFGYKKMNVVFFMKENFFVFISIFMLYILSILGGSMILWMFFYFKIIILSKFMKMMVLLLCMLGMILGYKMYYFNFINSFLWSFFSSMWFMSLIYMNLYINILNFSLSLYLKIDKGVLEYYGPKILKFTMFVKFYLMYLSSFNFFSMVNLTVSMMFYYLYLN